MKRSTQIIVLLLIVLGSALFWYYQSNIKNTKKPITEKTKTILTEVEQPILLYVESGEVSFKFNSNEAFQKATTSSTVIPNKTIVHTYNGKASVLLPDNSSISLDKNTEITVNYSKTDTSILQSLGTTYHRVEKLLSGSSYKVQTPGTLAAVRGTKFAVKYDSKKKKTKLSVTEHKVEVSSAPEILGEIDVKIEKLSESIMVDEGKTVQVENIVKVNGMTEQEIDLVDTSSDTEMKVWVEEQKVEDIQIEAIKEKIFEEREKRLKDSSNPEEDTINADIIDRMNLRKEIRKEIFKDEKADEIYDNKESEKDLNVDLSKEEVSIKEPLADTTNTENTEIKNSEPLPEKPISDTVVQVKPIIAVSETLINKMNEEEFFSNFEPIFIKYFYLDKTDSACAVRVTPEERVRIVSSYASNNGYPFKSDTLLPFAKDIDLYCLQKDPQVKIKLQTRFDDEFPFGESL